MMIASTTQSIAYHSAVSNAYRSNNFGINLSEDISKRDNADKVTLSNDYYDAISRQPQGKSASEIFHATMPDGKQILISKAAQNLQPTRIVFPDGSSFVGVYIDRVV